MPAAPPPEERRGPGRPRTWASEAERVRAYRQRKAEEHADIDALRVERRSLRRQLSDAVRGRQRAETALEREHRRADRLQDELDRARERLRRVEDEIGWLRSKNEDLPAAEQETATLDATRGPGLSRQQRRAIERKKGKRSR